MFVLRSVKEKNYLILHQKDSPYTFLIKEGKKIKVDLIDSSKVSGKFLVSSDSTIIINDKTIFLDKISQIIGTNTVIVPILIAKYIVGPGFIAFGIAMFSETNNYEDIIPWIGISVGAMITYSGIKQTIRGRKFSTNSGWAFSIGRL